ncbi:MAG: hypothetical protein LBQ83_04350 [Candidatus Margulisbacteria bacterium]|jgi:microcystin-dependent protein|nr:hypothetical protein [Candidatus Margulisiibacteriota bacterium]
MVIRKGEPMLAQDILDLRDGLQNNIDTVSANITAAGEARALELQNNIDTVFANVTAAGKARALELQNSIDTLSANVADLSFFPVGAILMIDGGWTDGRGGWYICDGRDTPYGNTPNLTGRFVRGGTAAGTTAGSDTVTLTIANLPAHVHGATGLVVNNAGEHTHTIKEGSNVSSAAPDLTSGDDHTNIIKFYQTTSSAGDHTHTLSGTTASAGSGAAFDIIPGYYTVIYIKKMA